MVFCFVQNFFSGQHELEYLTVGDMTKTLNQIFFFPQSKYFFQQHWESEYFFRKKNIPPPMEVKWSVPWIL
jgi:hypothetical protein